MRKAPRYCHGFVDRHGKPRWYFRRPGFKRVALPGLPWSPDFMAVYAAAMRCEAAPKLEIGASRTKPGTVSALVVAYYNNVAFKTLAEGTQKMRRAILERFRTEHGDKRVALLGKGHVAKILGSKSPAAARNWRKTLRGLMQFAVSIEWRTDDPTANIELPRLKSDGIHAWTEAEIQQFEKTHKVGTRPRLALALLLYTAQRRSDVVRMGRQNIKNRTILVRQAKTGRSLEIPVHPDLSAVIEATPAPHLTFLTTSGGKAFSPAGFGNLFREWCNEAKLPSHCSAHGLRKAACRRLAEAGCSEKQIAAISGHESLSEVQRYTKAADQARLARDAMRAMLETFPTKKTRTKIGKPQ